MVIPPVFYCVFYCYCCIFSPGHFSVVCYVLVLQPVTVVTLCNKLYCWLHHFIFLHNPSASKFQFLSFVVLLSPFHLFCTCFMCPSCNLLLQLLFFMYFPIFQCSYSFCGQFLVLNSWQFSQSRVRSFLSSCASSCASSVIRADLVCTKMLTRVSSCHLAMVFISLISPILLV